MLGVVQPSATGFGDGAEHCLVVVVANADRRGDDAARERLGRVMGELAGIDEALIGLAVGERRSTLCDAFAESRMAVATCSPARSQPCQRLVLPSDSRRAIALSASRRPASSMARASRRSVAS